MLTITNVTYRIGNRSLFEGASARLSKGQKVGVVGENGSGKTTLLRLITGSLQLDGGRMDIQNRCRTGSVSQDAPGGPLSPLVTVLAADKERNTLMEAAERATLPDEVAHIHNRLAEIDAHSAPARAAVILSGLGFSEDMQHRPLSSFSGGWRMRVALAQALFSAPDLLLLDEPTNHLDLESIMWLETYLKGYPYTLVVVSHDRDLLNRVADNILQVKDGKLFSYSGGYDAFVLACSSRQAQQMSTAARVEAQRKHLQSFIDRFKAKATKAKQAQSRIKALERLETVEFTSSNRHINFDFPGPLSKPSPLVTIHGASVGYGPLIILKDLHLSVYGEDRIALLGANGNGKTTLARLLSASLMPTEGELVPAGKLKVGYFAQDHLEKLTLDITAFEEMRRAMPDAPQDKVRGWLGRFGFEQQRAEVIVGNLSGGEKTRLALALLALERPNLMILDEPTNHLDVDSREGLIDGLNRYDGAIILISHDRTLIENTCEQLWLVAGGTCTQYFGDMEDYREMLLKDRRGTTSNLRLEGSDIDSRASRKHVRRDAAQNRARVAPLKKAAEQAEAELEVLSVEKDRIDSELSDPSVYSGPADRIASLTKRQKELEPLMANAEERWLEAAEKLESALIGDDE